MSFAGENRAYARAVADALRAEGVVVFYDEYELVRIWGADLAEFMDNVYRNEARFVVVFTSEHYARKVWTMHEKRSALARVMAEGLGYLLPVRLDETDIPGLPSLTGAVDGALHTAAEVAAMILTKLGRPGIAAAPEPIVAVPLTPRDQQRVLVHLPPGWEYLLLAGAIVQGLERLESKRLDHGLRYAPDSGHHLHERDVTSYVQLGMDRLASATARLEALFGPGRLTWAIGTSGEPGDPMRIQHLGHRFVTTYEEILDWAATIRGTSVSPDLRPLLAALADLADEPVRSITRYSDELVSAAGRIAMLANAGEAWPTVEITITVGLDPAALENVMIELARLKARRPGPPTASAPARNSSR